MKDNILEEQLKTEYRNGDFAVECEACGERVRPEDLENFGGKICKNCHKDVMENL